MPSTIGFFAVATAIGSLLGLMVGHWPAVARWLHRCLEDPVGRPLASHPDASATRKAHRTW